MTNESALIHEVTQVTPELVDAWARLLPQLSGSAPPVTAEILQEILDDPGSILFVAREMVSGSAGGDGSEVSTQGAIIGSLTLATFRIPTGVRAWIEDVVVDEEARGKRVGELLTRAAIDRAHRLGARTVELTSRPSREAANRLYQRVGFEQRETNVYRYSN